MLNIISRFHNRMLHLLKEIMKRIRILCEQKITFFVDISCPRWYNVDVTEMGA